MYSCLKDTRCVIFVLSCAVLMLILVWKIGSNIPPSHVHSNAYQTVKKEKHPFLKSNSPEPEEERIEIPDQLLCPLCSNLMTDAVLIPCCGESFCDECESHWPINQAAWIN